MAQKYIRSEYNGTVVLSNIRKGRASIPVVGMNDIYTATKVTEWYDGTPMTPEKVDGSVYLQLKDTGEYFKVNLPNEGETYLEKDTMEQMRGLSDVEILLLKMGYYKGATLNGYYEKGDTPAPIKYQVVKEDKEDDGGLILNIKGVTLISNLNERCNSKYYGIFPNTGEFFGEKVNQILRFISIEFDEGEYRGHVSIPENKNIYTKGCVTLRATEEERFIIETFSSIKINNLHLNGYIEEGKYAGGGLLVRGSTTGTVEISKCTFSNVVGKDLSKGDGNLISLNSGDYFIDIKDCIFDSHASDLGEGISYRFSSRAIYISSINGGVIDNCVFFNDGKIDGEYLSGVRRDDIESITVNSGYYDDDKEDRYFKDCLLTISNCKSLDAQTRAFKIQASGVKIINNSVLQKYQENVSGKLACISIIGSGNIVANNTLESEAYTCINVNGRDNIITSNILSVNKDNLYSVGSNSSCIHLYTSIAGTSGREVPNIKTTITNNTMFAERAISILTTEQLVISNNNILGQIAIVGSGEKHGISILNNVVDIPNIYSNRNGIEIRLTPDSKNTSNIIIKNNNILRSTRGIDVNPVDGRFNGYFIIKDNLGQSSNSNFINRLNSNIKKDIQVYNDEASVVKVLKGSTERFNINNIQDKQGFKVKSDGGAFNIENSPSEGYWYIEDKLINNDKDHLQIAFKTNSNTQSDLTGGEVYYRVYSEIGTSTGWSPWINIITKDQLQEEREIILSTTGTTIFYGALSPFWFFNSGTDFTINPTLQRGRIYVKGYNTSETEITITVVNGIFPDGGSSYKIPPKTKRLLSITAINYQNDRLCFVEE